MAKSIVIDLDLNTNIDEADKSINELISSTKSLKTQLKELEAATANATNPEEMRKFAKAAGELKDRMGDARQQINNFASDTQKLDVVVGTVRGVAGAFATVQGAIGLLSGENKKLEETLVTVQSSLLVLNGIQEVTNVLNKDSAVGAALWSASQSILNFVLAGTSIELKILKGALVATGIGIFIVAIGSLVSYMSNLTSATKATAKANEEAKKSFDDLNKSVNDIILKGQQEIQALNTLKESLNSTNISLEARKELYRQFQETQPVLTKLTYEQATANGVLNKAISDQIELIDLESKLKAINAVNESNYRKQYEVNLKTRQEAERKQIEIEEKNRAAYRRELINRGDPQGAEAFNPLTEAEKEARVLGLSLKDAEEIIQKLAVLQGKANANKVAASIKTAELTEEEKALADTRAKLAKLDADATRIQQDADKKYALAERDLTGKQKEERFADIKKTQDAEVKLNKEARDAIFKNDAYYQKLSEEDKVKGDAYRAEASKKQLDAYDLELVTLDKIKYLRKLYGTETIETIKEDSDKELDILNKKYADSLITDLEYQTSKKEIEEKFRKEFVASEKKKIERQFESMGSEVFRLANINSESSGNAVIDEIERQIAKNKKLLQIEKLTADEYIAIQDKIYEYQIQLANKLEEFNRQKNDSYIADLRKTLDISQSLSNAEYNKSRKRIYDETRLLNEQFEQKLITQEYYDSRTKEMDKQSEAAAKKSFEDNKKIQIAQAIIDTLVGAQKTYNSLAQIPYVGPVVGGVAAGAALAAGAARVQEISSTFYEGSTSLSSGSGTSISSSIQASLQNPFSNTQTSGVITPQTQLNSGGPLRVFVVESDITDVVNRVKLIESRSRVI